MICRAKWLKEKEADVDSFNSTKKYDVAVKLIKLPQEILRHEKEFKALEKEMMPCSFGMRMYYDNIVSIYGCTFSKGRIGLVMELCSNGLKLIIYFLIFLNYLKI